MISFSATRVGKEPTTGWLSTYKFKGYGPICLRNRTLYSRIIRQNTILNLSNQGWISDNLDTEV
jgi:hypothetical protein